VFRRWYRRSRPDSAPIPKPATSEQKAAPRVAAAFVPRVWGGRGSAAEQRLSFPGGMSHHREKEAHGLAGRDPNTEAAILARVIESDATAITPDVARYLLSMQLPRSDQERVNELSAKARAGSLSEGETQELDSYLHIGRLLAVMQSRARRLLQNPETDLSRQ